ncbi:hypothetical protein HPP92_013705 [Vanilla planifolia]|uniref:Uncharacterized protein n=1 Tax=Vanilla planifolia TaxID=51239 RepID=A0A835QST9_VANPL|nr:hypothetical protein HPP92_013705 [Vanilla planifolia]
MGRVNAWDKLNGSFGGISVLVAGYVQLQAYEHVVWLLTSCLQGRRSGDMGKSNPFEEACERIIWIAENTLNTMLLEKVVEVVELLLLSLFIGYGIEQKIIKIRFGRAYELSNLEDKLVAERTCIIDQILCLVEALSTLDYNMEKVFAREELYQLICRVIKLPEKFEFTCSRVSAVVIIANLLVDGQHFASQLSQDYEFIEALLDTIPLVSDDSQARDAIWCILSGLLPRIQSTISAVSLSIFLHQSLSRNPISSRKISRAILLRLNLPMEKQHFSNSHNPVENCMRRGGMARTEARKNCRWSSLWGEW